MYVCGVAVYAKLSRVASFNSILISKMLRVLRFCFLFFSFLFFVFVCCLFVCLFVLRKVKDINSIW